MAVFWNPFVKEKVNAKLFNYSVLSRAIKLFNEFTKNVLGFKPYKLQKFQLLTDKKKLVPLQRCRQFQHRAEYQQWMHILFTDEKLFTVKQMHKHQNVRGVAFFVVLNYRSFLVHSQISLFYCKPKMIIILSIFNRFS